MKIEMYQRIFLKNGKRGRVIEIFKGGEAYMIDVMSSDGEYEQVTIFPRDIKSVIVETEQPYTATA
jgi:hypothetical protein